MQRCSRCQGRVDEDEARAVTRCIQAHLIAGNLKAAVSIASTAKFRTICRRLGTCPVIALELLRRQAERHAEKPDPGPLSTISDDFPLNTPNDKPKP